MKKTTAMKALIVPLELLLLLSLVLSSSIIDISRGEEEVTVLSSSHRRILHQPLFPIDSTPPSPTDPPPSPSNSDIPDQPFLPEVPNGQTANQQPPPVVPATAETPTQEVPIATQPSKPAKKVAIAISVGIVTLGMLSGLAFFLYRYRVKHQLPTERLGGRSRTENTSSRRGNNNSNEVNEDQMESPYHKLNSLRSSELYRPSPELQPLPPLNRAAAITTSPPVVPFGSSRRGSSAVSSDEETLTSPQLSVKNGENTYMSASRQVFPANTNTKSVTHTTGSSPQSRRSSPKSRFSVSSSPDVKQAIVPSPSSPSLPPLPLPPAQQARDQYDQPRTPSPTKRKAKFRSPPSPPPNLLLPSSINDQQQPRAAKIPVPPPPPPPPPRPPLPPQTMKSVKVKPLEASSIPMSAPVLTMPQSIMTSPKANTCVEVPVPVPVPVPVAKDTKEASPESVEMVEDKDEAKPKLKPLHWDKVRANSDRAMVWDQMKSSTFQLNEDMIETLFGCNNTNGIQKESTRRSVLPPPVELLDNRVLDPKKSQNIAILLRALNVTRDEVSEALLDGNPEGLGAELLETLVKMAPTKEEELKLRNYSGDITKLGTAERFLKDILEIPFAFTRVDAMLYRANFDTEVKYLRKSFETLEVASEELKKSRLFLKLLEAVLRTGNRMNVGTNRGDARAFKLDTLLKLVDIKGTDGKTTLLHFVVQEIIRSEGEEDSDPKPEHLLNHIHPKVNEDDFRKQGLQVVAGLSKELGSVKKAAGMDADILSSYVAKLEVGLKNVRLVLQYDKPDTQGKKFFQAMQLFLNEAEEEILRIKGVEKRALSHVKEVTEYFHGDTTKEGAHPFRIFVIVRDFLSVLDQVCREVGKMHERTMMGVARSFRISANVPLPVLNRFNTRQDKSSDED